MIETGQNTDGAWENAVAIRGKGSSGIFPKGRNKWMEPWTKIQKVWKVAKKLEGFKWSVKEKNPKGQNGILIWEPKSAYCWAQRKLEMLTEKGGCVHLAAWILTFLLPLNLKGIV